jgi:hypothetical protein
MADQFHKKDEGVQGNDDIRDDGEQSSCAIIIPIGNIDSPAETPAKAIPVRAPRNMCESIAVTPIKYPE